MEKALNELAQADGAKSRGAVFARVEVVEFMLDVVGYVADAPLHRKTMLEPLSSPSFARSGTLENIQHILNHALGRAPDFIALIAIGLNGNGCAIV